MNEEKGEPEGPDALWPESEAPVPLFGAGLQPADHLLRRDIRRFGTAFDQRHPDINAAWVHPRPPKLPHRVALPLGVVEDLGGREQSDVDDGVKEDEVAATHLRGLALSSRPSDEIKAVEVGATRPVVRHWRVRLRHSERL